MNELFYYVYLVPLALGAISSLNSFRLGWPRPLQHFSIFLIVTLGIEMFALAWKYQWHATSWWHFSPNNLWIYNLYLVPQYLFYTYFFSQTSAVKSIRQAGLYVGWFYGTSAVLNLLFVQGLNVIDYHTIIAAAFIILFFTTAYFVYLMKANKVIQLARQPLVWIGIGAFIFHLGSLPCFILINYISTGNMVLALSLFRIIILLNTLMYSAYTIAFLCTRKFPMPLY